jgi:hypothetical protein
MRCIDPTHCRPQSRSIADVEVKLVACAQDLEKLDAEIAKHTRSNISGDGTVAKRLDEAAAKRARTEAWRGKDGRSVNW